MHNLYSLTDSTGQIRVTTKLCSGINRSGWSGLTNGQRSLILTSRASYKRARVHGDWDKLTEDVRGTVSPAQSIVVY